MITFYPNHNISRRFRYPSERKGKFYSYLHNHESDFRLDNLLKCQNWQLGLFAINYNNTDKNEGVKLNFSKSKTYENNENLIWIKTNQIKFDFIDIEKIQKSKLEGKQKENLRILAEIINPQTNEKLSIISKIIRNKGPGIQDDLYIHSIGRPPSMPNWRHLIITFQKNLLYYPEEMSLQINDRKIKCSTESNSTLQYRAYEFVIPEEILQEREESICVLECLDFKKRITFSNQFFDIDKRKRKSCKSVYQDSSVLTDLSSSTQCKNEDFQMDTSHQVHDIAVTSDNSRNDFKDENFVTIQTESNQESIETQDTRCLNLPLIREDRERIKKFSDSSEINLLIQTSIKNGHLDKIINMSE